MPGLRTSFSAPWPEQMRHSTSERLPTTPVVSRNQSAYARLEDPNRAQVEGTELSTTGISVEESNELTAEAGPSGASGINEPLTRGHNGEPSADALNAASSTRQPISVEGAEEREVVTAVDTMSVRELKSLIARAGLDCRDCIDKADIRKRATEALELLTDVCEGEHDLAEEEQAEEEESDVERVVALLGRFANHPDRLIGLLKVSNPPPDSCAAMVLELLQSGIEPIELLEQLHPAAISAGSAASGNDGLAASTDALSTSTECGSIEMYPLPARSDSYSRVPASENFPRVRMQWTSGSGAIPSPLQRVLSGRPNRAACRAICGSCVACGVLAVVLLWIWYSIAVLPALTFGLDYNWIWPGIGSYVYTDAGLHWLGIGHTFIQVPSTIQTLTFTDGAPIFARSADGLPLTLHITAQWRYEASSLREMFLMFPPQDLTGLVTPGEQAVRLRAHAEIQNVAVEFAMHSFFEHKMFISKVMEKRVAIAFMEYGISVSAFQLASASPPSWVDQAILTSAVTKLNITTAYKYTEVMKVIFAMQKLAALYQMNVRITEARGQALQRREVAKSRIAMTAQTVSAEMRALQNVTLQVNVSQRQVLNYKFFDAFVADGTPQGVTVISRTAK